MFPDLRGSSVFLRPPRGAQKLGKKPPQLDRIHTWARQTGDGSAEQQEGAEVRRGLWGS